MECGKKIEPVLQMGLNKDELVSRTEIGALTWRIKAGSGWEGSQFQGLSQIARHAIFFGSSKLSSFVLKRRAELSGAQIWVEGDHQDIVINAICSREKSTEVSYLISEMVSNLLEPMPYHFVNQLPERLDLDHQISTLEDSTLEYLWNAAFSSAYRIHGGSPTVSKNKLENFSPEKLVEFWEKSLSRPIKIGVAGLHLQEVENGIKSASVKFKFSSTGHESNAQKKMIKYYGGGDVRITKSSSGSDLLLAYPTAGLSDPEEHAIISIISELVGDGVSTLKYGQKNSSFTSNYCSGHLLARMSMKNYDDYGMVGVHLKLSEGHGQDWDENVVKEGSSLINALSTGLTGLNSDMKNFAKARLLLKNCPESIIDFSTRLSKDINLDDSIVKSIGLPKMKSVS